MASNVNTVTIVGNLTRDPEVRYTNGGDAVAQFGIAFNTRKKNRDGQWEDGDPGFYNVVVWGELGENVADSLSKGMRAVVVGELEYRTWEAKEGGGKRSEVRIKAEEVCPSLRWATATVERTERRDGASGGSGGGRGSGDRGQSRSGSSRSSGSEGRGSSRSEPAYDPNEEPF